MELELKLESELGAMVAVTVVALSVFMAITKLKDENIIQAMQHTQVSAVDSWNEYQAERIKLHVDENDLAALKLRTAGTDAGALGAETKRLSDKLGHYGKASDALAKDARADEAHYQALDFRHDQFDMADALCSIALALSAVAALANRRALLFIGWGVGAAGIFMGIAGLAAWNVHPEWLASLFG
jgi:phage host-nuclease inhibitor protein Gam